MEKKISAAIILVFGTLGAYDVFLETDRASSFHILLEAILVTLAFSWAIYLIKQLFLARDDVNRWRNETRKWTEGLAQTIEQQFDQWKLTPAEKEVALLLMKGLEHKEIAEIRGTTERTARQQSTTLYQKSALGGRAELTAFFLEDLLVRPQLPETSARMSFDQ